MNEHRFNEVELQLAADRAVLPFRILEEMRIPCGYERSFKLLPGRLLANRYLLGVDLTDITSDQLRTICQRLYMPDEYVKSLKENLADANLVFLGFEDNPPHGTYKIYLEFWEQVKSVLNAERAAFDSKPTQPRLLHLGFKWDAADNSQRKISKYFCHPLLSAEEICMRMVDVYSGHETAPSLAIATEILAFAAGRSGSCPLIYMEVVEDDSQRRSYDINLYSAELRLGDIKSSLSKLREYFEIPINSVDRLLQLTCNKLFGHLSGGISQEGEEFLTIYYEA